MNRYIVYYIAAHLFLICGKTIANEAFQSSVDPISIAVFKCKIKNSDINSNIWSEVITRSITSSLTKIHGVKILIKANEVMREMKIAGSNDIDEAEAVRFGKLVDLRWVVLVKADYRNGIWNITEQVVEPKTSQIFNEFVLGSTNWSDIQRGAVLQLLHKIGVEPSPTEISCMSRQWSLQPETIFQYTHSLMLLSDSTKMSEAADIVETITNNDKNFAEAYALLGAIRGRQGKLKESESLAATAVKLGEGVSYAHKIYGYTLLADNKVDEAETEFITAATLNPDDADLFENIGDIHILFNELTEAIKYFKQAIILCPYGVFAANIQTKLNFWEPRSQLYYFSQKPPNAPAILGDYFQKSPESMSTNYFANPLNCTIPMTKWAEKLTFGSTNQLEKAKLIFNTLIQHVQFDKLDIQPRTASEVFSAWGSADVSFHCQEYAFLYVALSRAVGLNSYFVETEETVDWHKELHTCAAVFLEGKMILVDPAYLWFGVRHLKFKVLNDAQASAIYLCSLQSAEACEKAAQLAPELDIVQLNLFKSRTLAGRWDMALQTLTNMMSQNPNSWTTIICQADVASHEGNIEQAIKLLTQASILSPGTGAIYVQLGDLYIQNKDTDSARKSYKDALTFMLAETDRDHVNNVLAHLMPANDQK